MTQSFLKRFTPFVEVYITKLKIPEIDFDTLMQEYQVAARTTMNMQKMQFFDEKFNGEYGLEIRSFFNCANRVVLLTLFMVGMVPCFVLWIPTME